MVFGVCPQAPLVLALLELTAADFGRFRDAWVEEVGDGDEVRLAVHTRCGGSNRAAYAPVFERMAAHPLFIGAEDGAYDRTYATFFFRPPPDALSRIEAILEEELPEGWTLRTVAIPPVDQRAKWNKAMIQRTLSGTGSPRADGERGAETENEVPAEHVGDDEAK